MEFSVDVLNVGGDGAVTDLEFLRNFLVQISLRQEFQDLLFAPGQNFGLMTGGNAGLAESLDNFAGDLAGDRGTAGAYLAEGREQFAGRGLFEEITIGTSHKSVKYGIALIVDGEHDELGPGQEGLEFADGIDAAHARQVDIHEHDIGQETGDFRHGIFTAGMLADALEVGGPVDQLHQSFTGGGVVFDDGNGDGHGGL